MMALLPTTSVMASISDGVASYYAERFDGRRTASGARFDMQALTAAHRTLDFGTRVKVTNKANGRSVEVVINDRGPFKRGRVIDLSKAAAREIGMLGAGLAPVSLEIAGTAQAAEPIAQPISVAEAQRVMMDLF
ncbi:MAG: septal ring lytic transglycosylase RlpA family protein [Sphingobacteriia bacterium]|nr:septal ring lytic transglycosylase RlpA family protein [Sphingobacteriia bacterium]NCC39786.1 septal ring lytic transglycosylase RlpA family protein [Gammaproteobacteria bacterium]